MADEGGKVGKKEKKTWAFVWSRRSSGWATASVHLFTYFTHLADASPRPYHKPLVPRWAWQQSRCFTVGFLSLGGLLYVDILYLGHIHKTISCSAPLRRCRLLFLQLLFELRRREIHPSAESEHLRTPFHLHPTLSPLFRSCTYLIGLIALGAPPGNRSTNYLLPASRTLERLASRLYSFTFTSPPLVFPAATAISPRTLDPTPRDARSTKPPTYTAADMAQTGAGGSYNNPLKKFK